MLISENKHYGKLSALNVFMFWIKSLWVQAFKGLHSKVIIRHYSVFPPWRLPISQKQALHNQQYQDAVVWSDWSCHQIPSHLSAAMSPPPLSLAPAPASLKEASTILFSQTAKDFLAKLLHTWEPKVYTVTDWALRVQWLLSLTEHWCWVQVEAILLDRRIKKLDYDKHNKLPAFISSPVREDSSWKVCCSTHLLMYCNQGWAVTFIF